MWERVGNNLVITAVLKPYEISANRKKEAYVFGKTHSGTETSTTSTDDNTIIFVID